MEPRAIRTCLIGYMPTSRQYKLYKPANSKVIVSTAPKIVEDKRVEITWQEPEGDVVIPFDPMYRDVSGAETSDISRLNYPTRTSQPISHAANSSAKPDSAQYDQNTTG